MARLGKWSLVLALVLMSAVAVQAAGGAVALTVEGKDFSGLAKKKTIAQPEATLVSLVLDDGSPDTGYWWGANTQFVWANRFTPAAGEFPFLLEEAYVVQDATAGDVEQILVYADYDGDGDIANATLLYRENFTASSTALQWLGGTFTSPVACLGPGDIWIACINRTPALYAVIDNTTSAGRSYIGSNSSNGSGGSEADPPAMPPGSWFVMGGSNPGNWLIRGYGATYDSNVRVTGISFADACPRCGTGGGNGFIDWGETITLTLTFTNDGPLPVTGLVAKLTGSFPNITITSDTANIGDLGVGASANGQFMYEVPVQAICGQSLGFTVTTTGNEYPGRWSSDFSQMVGNFVAGPETPILTEDFSIWPPLGWTIGGTGLMWREGSTNGDCNSTNSVNHTGGAGQFPIADSDCFGNAMDASLISPAFSLVGTWPSAYLEFKSDYWVSGYYNTMGEVLLSTDGGATWPTVIFNYTANARGPRTEKVDISSYIGQANCAVAFHYYTDGWDWWWQVDDVRVYGKAADQCQSFPCTPQVVGSHHGCIGSSVLLSTQAATTYQWMVGGANIPGATDQAFTAVADGNYQVTTFDGTCLATSALHPVIFHALPTPTVTGDAVGCVGIGVELSTQAYTSYQWYFNAAIIPGATNRGYSAMNAGDYSVRVTDTYGCAGTSPNWTVAISNPTPTISGPTEGCANPPVTLSTELWVSYQWALDGADIPGATNRTYNPTLTGGYTVAIVDNYGCQAMSGTLFFTAMGPSPTVSGPSPACIPGVLTTQAFSTYQWMLGGTDIPGATDISYSVTAAGSYSVRVTDANGCIGVSSFFDIFLSPVPTINGPSPACTPSALTTQAFSSYQWKLNGSDIPDATDMSYNATAAGSYSVQVTNAGGCVGVSSFFDVFASPAPAITGPSPACVPGVLTTQAFFSYQWKIGGVDIPGATDISYNATAAGSYSVQVTGANGCTAVSSFFDIFNTPAPTIEGAAPYCIPTVLSTQAFASSTYQWNLGGGPIAGATDQAYTPAVGGSYSVTVTNASGCQATSPAVVVFNFCPTTEVSPSGGAFPARLVPSTQSPTGYYLYFAVAPGAMGYNVYEGTIGNWYSHGAIGNICDIPYSDLGTGELRATYTPTVGDHYYLVTAWGDGGEGPSGYKTGSPTPIDPSLNTCAP